MKALARAVINAAAYLDLSGDEGLSADESLHALEEIAYNLSLCTDDEKAAVREVLADMRAAEVEGGARPDVLEFLDGFLASFGMEDDPQAAEPDRSPRINLL